MSVYGTLGVSLAPEVAQDLEQIFDQLQRHEAAHVAARLHEIIAAIDVLETNPLIGRPAGGDRCERVIGHGAHGNLALYCHVAQIDTVFVLAVRSQREAGFAGP
ncbi:type II toxin-antitoxin system RelE/ParE family toxin [Xanthomonas arboricola]|uniref:type II toxin-antitoxin system RelE/ParE family toxin n=1 Tax=Xanthomonas arboricola TaxID=56448 RepID=UPI0025B1D27D|nr:type II toxin-antitoxin system RelE/ParE family toxin [Xanthomonas arboricola]MDN0222668.1 type II toxin-antitoxin system RelE/ParE family toxin [Xanthomonas arboricola pv. juglandis]MDN0226898.1 type II toxin-antitoxin system RelE/ParE family toxin [Xanthomonas arboricola pv. juglandis]MDN0231157.1 type II toxin-antitoxin system RelE/ParE family toxin [Xanthomonas arboricola pv. juglandis]MDN0235420.1 type II toxin-antitoxin system RelE/ParE family toxin [Xanthomonas arboricola pv. juglandi